MEIVKRIHKQAAIILLPLALLSAIIEWKRLPLSIIIGGILALTNLKGLAWGIKGLVGAPQASGKLLFFSLIRLALLFAVLIILLMLKLINIIGIFIGFTVVFMLLLKEGLRSAKEEL